MGFRVDETKMRKETIIKKIRNNKNELKKCGVKKIGLFGSYLKNKARWGSDIDLIITLDKKTFRNYMEALFLLKSLLKRKIDLVIEEDLKPELDYIKEEAVYVRI